MMILNVLALILAMIVDADFLFQKLKQILVALINQRQVQAMLMHLI